VISAALALIPHGVALASNVEPADWLDLGAASGWGIAPDAMLFTAAFVTLAAPVAGVAVAARELAARATTGASPRRVLGPLLMWVVGFCVVSALLTFVWSAGRPDAWRFVATTHVTLLSVALALAAGGALCGAWFRNPLDAAASGLAIAMTAAAGLLVAGAAVSLVPRTLVEWGLTASPFVAVTSAAHIDILHMDLLYQISPLAHLRVDYPEWRVASCGYMAVTALSLVIMSRLRIRQPESPM
jgi:hypothetical protein